MEFNLKVMKRDGTIVDYSKEKIVNAINKAIIKTKKNSDIKISDKFAEWIASDITTYLFTEANQQQADTISVPLIQELVESKLKYKNILIYNEYHNYRLFRDRNRERNLPIMKKIKEMGISTDRDNANVGNNFSAKLLRIASEGNKWQMLNTMPEEFAHFHISGDGHIHDLDSFNLATNCLHLPTKQILKKGFNTGYGRINPPKRIETAGELSCIALQSSQNDCFGGQAHPNFDNDLSEFVEDTRKEERQKILDSFIINFGKKQAYELIELPINKNLIEERINKRVHQAMQGVIYNLNTMHSRAGSQVPFSSINLGIPENKDAALICKAFLEEYIKGMGNGEQPIFPNIIFRVKDGVNFKPGDPYYYLFQLACKSASKRMNPTFMNIDATFNKKYYDMGILPATMGCVDGDEIITYKFKNKLFVEGFRRMWKRLSKYHNILTQKDGINKYMDLENSDVTIWDIKNGFVKVKKIIKNKDNNNWVKVTFSNGRQLLATDNHPLPIIETGRTPVDHLQLGNSLVINSKQYTGNKKTMSTERAWLYGFILCNGFYKKSLKIPVSLIGENDVQDHYIKVIRRQFNSKVTIKDKQNKEIIVINPILQENLVKLFGGIKKDDRHIPNKIFRSCENIRRAFLAGIIDGNNYNNQFENKDKIRLGSTNKELILQTMALAQSIGLYASIHSHYYSDKNTKKIMYVVEFIPDDNLVSCIISEKKKTNLVTKNNQIGFDTASVTSIEKIGYMNNYSYDVETESDLFEVSGIYSHNCRTYLMKNVNGEPGVEGRGNIAPITINLVRLGLRALTKFNKDETEERIKYFYKIFEEKIELCHRIQLYRYDNLKKLKVKDLPFVAGEKLMKGAENLGPNDSIEPILKQGTWGIGFIGLAETLVALTGHHHGQDEESKKLGYEIIEFLNKQTKYYTEKDKLNWSTYASPAEGTSGKFVPLDRELFGVYEGINDREYYTNSFHVPVYFPISIAKKILIEAPFHELCDGGHISYVEIDDYPSPELIEEIIRFAYTNSNISYMGVNFHIRYCKDCGEQLHNEQVCPKCGSRNIQGISRVTGYLSLDERFGASKVAERRDRVSHNKYIEANNHRIYNMKQLTKDYDNIKLLNINGEVGHPSGNKNS